MRKIDKFKFINIIIQMVIINNMSQPGNKKYILSILLIYSGVLISLLKRKTKLNLFKEQIIIIIRPILFYLILGTVISIIKGNFTMMSIKVIIFNLLPIMAAYYTCYYMDKRINIINTQFYCIAINFIFNNLKTFTINNLMESTEAFIFGAYFIYYLNKKNYKNLTLSLILLILAHKRIAIGSCLIILIISLAFDKIKFNKNKMNLILIFNFISILIYNFYIYNGKLISIFRRYNINDMGRFNIYKQFNKHYSYNIGFNGNGIGYVMKKLEEINIWKGANLHNDWLALFIEIGFIGLLLYFLIYLISFNKLYIVNKNVTKIFLLLYIYSSINWLTDNISIYIYFSYPFYCMIFHLYKNSEINNKNNNKVKIVY